MFVALEVLSLPLYLISGLARRRRLLSQEAAVKYFLLGAFASAFFLYGAGAGLRRRRHRPALRASAAADRGRARRTRCSFGGLALLVVGLLFKASVGPFHTWTPDVYQGAPTPVTAFMAACTKVAAFGAILRLLYVAFGTDGVDLAAADLRRRDRVDGRRRRPRPHPDRPQADARLLLDRARRLPAHRRAIAHRRRHGPVGHAVLPARLRAHHDRRSSPSSPGARRRRRGRRTSRSGRGWPALAGDRRRDDRSSCSRWPGSR